MASSHDNNMNDLVADVYPFFRIYKDGQVEHFDDISASIGFSFVPPSLDDPKTSVSSKDVTISPYVSARLYLPKNTTNITQKLPILVYYHGGGFVVSLPQHISFRVKHNCNFDRVQASP